MALGRRKPGLDCTLACRMVSLRSTHPTVSSLRGLRVILDRRARAYQIAVAIDVVDSSHRAPVFIHPRDARREAALGAGVGTGPRIVGDVVHGVRRVAQ